MTENTPAPQTGKTDIPAALAALRAGKPVLVADNEDRENEGDAIISAALAGPEWIAWMVRHTSGYLCAPMPGSLADRLRLPFMTMHSQDPNQTAYTISVDATDRRSTGISAAERAHTINVLASPEATFESVIRPGHVLPLRAREGGVLERGGHTEAAVDLMRLAGLYPVGCLAEMVHDDGTMVRYPDLVKIGETEGLAVITVAQIAQWRREHPEQGTPDSDPEANRVSFDVEAELPTSHGDFLVRGYHDGRTGAEHVALVSKHSVEGVPLVRVHSECLTGEAFGSLRCECGPQLQASLERIAREGGAVIYLRGHEGRGIGLLDKLRAYKLQDGGLDTVDANLALGHQSDEREYGSAAAILHDLGMERIRLLSNNPDKTRALEAHGITVTEQVPLVVGTNAVNQHYLETKRDRMGHLLPQDL
ncbi:MAG: GTP cyclohydrolase II [Microbacteriaceae bacterium]|jgi:3,4-dihydroxy 2-butanone 4-phosphate synthase/GTP cyclohydrolase II|nr:GTP cyclohydrolase II [Microbacteriaceae bacterium]MCI1207579.1 GTP cyclohydrolase II [Microbacteriaceae bacterium]